MNYQEIGLQYGIIVHKVERGDKWWKVNGSDAYLNESACAGRDEIWVGVYDNKDEEIAAFFHELGHCITTNLKDFHHTEFDKFHMELDAWIVGLTEAYKYKYLMEPSTFRYMVKCLESYIGWEEREIKGFNTKEK
jgi:hypothetical protein